jgi:hypothetical protein
MYLCVYACMGLCVYACMRVCVYWYAVCIYPPPSKDGVSLRYTRLGSGPKVGGGERCRV